MSSFFRLNACLIILLLILSSTVISNAESISLATGEWAPYTSKKMPGYGEFTQLVTIVFKEMGIKPVYKFYPWRRCFDTVVKGRVWAAFPYSYTKNRAKKVWFSDPLSCSKTLFFYYEKADSTKSYLIKNLDDLNPYKLGCVRGYYYEDFFKKSGLNINYVNKEINAIEMLTLGRIDFMPVNEQVGWNLIETHFSEQRHHFKVLSMPLSVDPLHLIISRDYPGSEKILKKFNQTLSTCVEKGFLKLNSCKSKYGIMK